MNFLDSLQQSGVHAEFSSGRALRARRRSGGVRVLAPSGYNQIMRFTNTFMSLLVIMLSVSLARADAIEGTTWKIRATPDSDGRALDDTITFKGGKFISAELAKRGFKETNYEDDTRKGGLSNFKVVQTSDKEGEARWTGTITAVDMRGELVFTKKDGSTVHYTFQGERPPK
jgi:hypothetical protein